MTALKQHCSLSYHKGSPDILDTFAIGVRDGIFNNSGTFATPPTTQVAFQAFIDDYANKRAAYKQGGKAQKGPYLDSKKALMNELDTLADYVDEIADGNEATILLAGFVPTKAGSTEPHAPAQPVIKSVTRGTTGELFAECVAQNGTGSYGCIVTGGQPLPEGVLIDANGQIVVRKGTGGADMGGDKQPENGVVFVLDLNKKKTKHFTGLQPHMMYHVYFYAVNASGVSPLSEPKIIECL